MKPFLRAILLSLRYKWTIAGAVLCSVLIALLWSASITTVFPVVKIVLEEKTAHSWVAEEIETAQRENKETLAQLDELTQQRQVAAGHELALIERKIDLKKNRLEAEQNAIETYQNLQPYIAQYAPDSPFETLVWAMVWLLATSILKGVLLVLSAILTARIAIGP